MRMNRPRAERDGGQVLPLMAVVVVVTAAIAVVVVLVGGALSDRAVARTAADAAALAAAVEGDGAAAEVAAANGATLVAVHRHLDQVEVVVSVGRATARARAEPTRHTGDEPGAHGSGRPIP